MGCYDNRQLFMAILNHVLLYLWKYNIVPWKYTVHHVQSVARYVNCASKAFRSLQVTVTTR